MNRFISYRGLGAGARREVSSWFSPSLSRTSRRSVHSPSFATVDIEDLSSSHPAEVKNFDAGAAKLWNAAAAAGIEPGPGAHDAMILAMLKSNRFEDAVAMLKSMRARRPHDVGLDS